MTAPVTASERDLCALAAIVSQDRPDLPDGEGLPLSLLADLMGQIRCDVISFEGFDSQREKTRFLQSIPDPDRAWLEKMDPVHWHHYWSCQPCSYPIARGTCAASCQSRTSTQPGNGTPLVFTVTASGRSGSTTI
jgi:hypothetical protein